MTADHGLYARSFADVYDAWYGDLDDPAHVVDAVAQHRQPPATVLELGSGTGRLATPLAQAGFHVIALDISQPMLAMADAEAHAVAADMTTLPARTKSVDVVLVAYNTLFNVSNRDLQRQCISEAARVLTDDGWLAVEAFVAPSDSPDAFGISQRPHPTDPDSKLTIVSGPHANQSGIIVGAHIETGTQRTCRPWQLAYQNPADLDTCARHAGLELVDRHGDWTGTTFDDDSSRHVSWYKAARSDLR